MPHSFVSNLMHCIFSTKDRMPLINAELELRLWRYMGGIAREPKMRALAIGGTADHVHTLLSLPPTMDIAKAVQLINKMGSRQFSPASEVCLAGGLRRIQCKRVPTRQDRCLDQRAKETSPQANIRGRIYRVLR
jgi:REP element-mobilizing transposase RayT